MIFKGWQKTSLIEYPGKISSIVFTGGCNFRCPFCYNAKLVERPQLLADLSAEKVLRYLEENRRLYQALMISGGEPTLHAQLPEFLAEVKALGLHTGVETNGSNPTMIARLIELDLVDYIAMDVKAPLEWEAYRRAAGLPQGREGMLHDVNQTLRHLKAARVELELRCTVVPRFHAPEDILQLAEQLRGYPHFVLQQFIPEEALDPRLRDQVPYNDEVLKGLHEKIRGYFDRCEVRGI